MKIIGISTIPPEVFEAADTLHNYFTRIGATDWECSHVADRRLVVNRNRPSTHPELAAEHTAMNTPTPRTDAAQHEGLMRGNALPTKVVRADFARQLERELAQVSKDRDSWKASHDNQVKIKNIIATRGDLKDRAPKVEKLVAELNQTKTNNAELLEALEACMKIIRPPSALANECWTTIDEINEAWVKGSDAIIQSKLK